MRFLRDLAGHGGWNIVTFADAEYCKDFFIFTHLDESSLGLLIQLTKLFNTFLGLLSLNNATLEDFIKIKMLFRKWTDVMLLIFAYFRSC